MIVDFPPASNTILYQLILHINIKQKHIHLIELKSRECAYLIFLCRLIYITFAISAPLITLISTSCLSTFLSISVIFSSSTVSFGRSAYSHHISFMIYVHFIFKPNYFLIHFSEAFLHFIFMPCISYQQCHS